MTKQTKDTIAICISKEILDFINEHIQKKKFADVSHAFELMAFEYMKNIVEKDETTLDRLERLTLGTVRRSVDVVRDTVGTAQDSTMKVYNESSEKAMGSSVVKGVMESAEKIQDSAMKVYKDSSDRVKESSIGKRAMDTAEKVEDSTMKAYEFSADKMKESLGMLKERISSKDSDDKEESDKGKKIEIDE